MKLQNPAMYASGQGMPSGGYPQQQLAGYPQQQLAGMAQDGGRSPGGSPTPEQMKLQNPAMYASGQGMPSPTPFAPQGGKGTSLGQQGGKGTSAAQGGGPQLLSQLQRMFGGMQQQGPRPPHQYKRGGKVSKKTTSVERALAITRRK